MLSLLPITSTSTKQPSFKIYAWNCSIYLDNFVTLHLWLYAYKHTKLSFMLYIKYRDSTASYLNCSLKGLPVLGWPLSTYMPSPLNSDWPRLFRFLCVDFCSGNTTSSSALLFLTELWQTSGECLSPCDLHVSLLKASLTWRQLFLSINLSYYICRSLNM